MAALSEAQRKKLLEDTKSIASVFLEDIVQIREIVNAERPTRAEIRQLSNLLRRLLVNREILRVAAPRMPPLWFLIPDNAPVVRHSKQHFLTFFQSGGSLRFAQMRGFAMHMPPPANPLSGFDSTRRAKAKLDGFLSQPVLCLNGKWATRQHVIKYAAICASGVHSKEPVTEEDKLLERIRHVVFFTNYGGAHVIQFNLDAISSAEIPFRYDPHRIDMIFVELLAAANLLVLSDDVSKLEEIIRTELGAHTPRSSNKKPQQP